AVSRLVAAQGPVPRNRPSQRRRTVRIRPDGVGRPGAGRRRHRPVPDPDLGPGPGRRGRLRQPGRLPEPGGKRRPVHRDRRRIDRLPQEVALPGGLLTPKRHPWAGWRFFLVQPGKDCPVMLLTTLTKVDQGRIDGSTTTSPKFATRT